MQKARVTPDYLMRVMFRRLEAKNVLPTGTIVGGSHQMMSANLHEPMQLLICPINLPTDTSTDIDNFGTLTDGVFHIYFRNRNGLDMPITDDIWLNDPDFGYYAVLSKSYRALSAWWPQGDLPDAKQGKLLTSYPLKCKTFNEPRRSWSDRTMGEGMFEIRARFMMEVDTVDPLV